MYGTLVAGRLYLRQVDEPFLPKGKNGTLNDEGNQQHCLIPALSPFSSGRPFPPSASFV